MHENHIDALGSSGNILIPLTADDDETSEAGLYDCQCYQNCNYVQYKPTVHVASGIEDDENRTIELHVHFNQDTLFSYRTSFIFTFLDLLGEKKSICFLHKIQYFATIVKPFG